MYHAWPVQVYWTTNACILICGLQLLFPLENRLSVLWQKCGSTGTKAISIFVRSRKRCLLIPILCCIIVLSILYLSILIDTIYCSISQNGLLKLQTDDATSQNHSLDHVKRKTVPANSLEVSWPLALWSKLDHYWEKNGKLINNYICIPGMYWIALGNLVKLTSNLHTIWPYSLFGLVLLPALIPKCHRLSSLNNRHVILSILETGSLRSGW